MAEEPTEEQSIFFSAFFSVRRLYMKKDKWMFFLAAIVFATAMILTSCNGTTSGDDGGDNGGTNPPTTPNAPSIQQISADNRVLTVQWGAVSDANMYNLYWNTTGGVTTSDNSVTGLLTPYYVHSGLSMFKTYYYCVTAVNSAGESALSNEMSALAAGTPAELWKRVASDAADEDYFGTSVAMSGDYVVVGAYYDDDGGTDSGAAYIYERNHGGQGYWGEVTKLTASDANQSDYFGISVAIDGDYVVVGAYRANAIRSGTVYIYNRNFSGPDNWGEVTKLTASDAQSYDYFGCAVGISGDYVVVGANRVEGAGTDRGAAYIYGRNFGGADSWGEVTKITASNPEDFAYFGDSVDISGDHVVVGAFYEDWGGTERGAAYVYNQNLGGADAWGEVARLTAADAADYDRFGFSVNIDGDYVIVGAWFKNGVWAQSGTAYIYGRNSGGADNWGEVAKLTASDENTADLFGTSVSISGDYIVVGAVGEDGAGTNRGAAYIYARDYGGVDNWGEVMKLTASDAEDGDRFGCSVSISGDYVVVGTEFEDGGGTDRGAIYIF